MVEDPDADVILRSKCKAISTLFPYAIRLEKGGQQQMVDAILRAARVSESISEGFKWRHIGTYITAVFGESSPPSLDRAITFSSPYVPWYEGSNSQHAVARWAAAALAVPYSEEVVQNVVNTLLRISDIGTLHSHIPIGIWEWLKKRPSLPPVCRGRSSGSWPSTVLYIRGLGDIEILKSYLLLIWSEWDCLNPAGLLEMQIAIREDFGGVTMWYHRDDLLERLDHVLGELDRGLAYFAQHKPQIDKDEIQKRKEQYGELKNVLLEVEKEMMKPLIRTSCKSIPPDCNILILVGEYRNPRGLCLCPASSVPMISRLQRLASLRRFVHQCSALPRRFLARNGIYPIFLFSFDSYHSVRLG